jgi:hypothetical protein
MKRRLKRRRRRGGSVSTANGEKKRMTAKAGKLCGVELPFPL